MAINIARREFIGTLAVWLSPEQRPMSIDACEGRRLKLRTSHSTTNSSRVGRRSFFPDTVAKGGRGLASSLPSSVQHP